MSQANKKAPTRIRKARKPAVDPAVSAAIGHQLKRIYDDVASEPIPDRFSKLLDALSRAEKDA